MRLKEYYRGCVEGGFRGKLVFFFSKYKRGIAMHELGSIFFNYALCVIIGFCELVDSGRAKKPILNLI